MEKTQYWPGEVGYNNPSGIALEARSALAFELVRIYGAIAGKRGSADDPTGRATLELQTPQELIDRCFEIADRFIDRAAERGELRGALSYQERRMRQALIDADAADAAYAAVREKKAEQEKK